MMITKEEIKRLRAIGARVTAEIPALSSTKRGRVGRKVGSLHGERLGGGGTIDNTDPHSGGFGV